MNCSSILIFEEPFSKILLLSNSVSLSDVSQTDYLLQFFNQNPIPHFSLNEIQIFTSLSSSKIHVSDAFSKICYKYPMCIQVIDAYLQPHSEIMYTSKYHSVVLYFNVLSWYKYYLATKSCNFASKILLCLLSQIGMRYPSHAISLFKYIYEDLITSNSTIIVKSFIDLLPKLFSKPYEFPPQMSDLFISSFNRILHDGNGLLDQNTKILLATIPLTAETHKNLFLADGADKIIKLLTELSLTLNPMVLESLLYLLKFASQEYHATLFNKLGAAMQHKYSTNAFNWPERIDVAQLPKAKTINGSLSFPVSPTFVNGFSTSRIINFPEKIDLNSMVSNEAKAIVDMLIPALKEAEIYSKAFVLGALDTISTIPQSHHISSYSNIFMALNALKTNLKKAVYLKLFTSSLFDPGINLFVTKDFQAINTLREIAFKGLIEPTNVAEDDVSLIITILSKFMVYPYLLAETVIRYKAEQKKFCRVMIASPKMRKFIRDLLMYLRTANCENKEHIKEIEFARESLYALLYEVMKKEGPRQLILDDHLFMTCFLMGLYEEAMWPETTLCLQQYMLSSTDKSSADIFGFFVQITASVSFKDDNTERYFKLISHLLQTTRNIIAVKRSLAAQTKLFNFNLCQMISIAPKSTDAGKILKEIIEYLTVCVIDSQFTTESSNLLTVAFHNQFGDDIPEEIVNILKKFMAADDSKAPGPDFVIELPFLALMCLDVFLHTKQFEKFNSFIMDMMDYSEENITRLHRGEFDIHILTILSRAKANNELNQNEFDGLLKMFLRIAEFISSPTVVKHYISLFCPLESGHISNYQSRFVNALYSLTTNAYRNRHLTHVMTMKPLPDHHLVCSTDTLYVFSWVKIHSAIHKVKLWSMISNSEISLCVDEESALIGDASFEYEFHSDVWYFISVAIKQKQNNTVVSLKINNVLLGKIDTGLFVMTGHGLTFKIGCCQSERDVVDIGTISLHEVDQSNNLILRGPFHIPDDTVAMHNNIDRGTSFAQGKHQSFVYTLANSWKADFILPLFGMFNYVMKTGLKWDLAPSITFSVLSRLLLTSEETSEAFAASVEHVEYMLTFYNSFVMNYELYLQIFSLFLSTPNPHLRMAILKRLLINPNLWMVAFAEDHLNIIKHISSVLLYSLNDDEAENCITFIELLDMLRTFYWYEPKDGLALGLPNHRRKRASDLNVNLCRNEIIKIILAIAKANPRSVDFTTLFGHCLTTADSEQVTSLLFLTNLIIQSSEQLLLTGDQASILVHILLMNNESFTIEVMKIFSGIICKDIFDRETLAGLLNEFIANLDINTLKESFMKEAISLYVTSVPELLSVICWCGTWGNEKALKATVDAIKMNSSNPSPRHKLGAIWYVWPTMLACKCGEGDRKDIIRFLLKVFTRASNLCACVDVITDIYCMLFNGVPGNLKSKFFEDLLNCAISNEISQTAIVDMIEYMFTFIVFRTHRFLSPPLEKLFDDEGIDISEFKIEAPKKEEAVSKRIKNRFDRAVYSINPTRMKRSFGLRFNNGEWNDINLAKKIVSIAPTVHEPIINEIGSYLCMLIAHVDLPFVNAQHQSGLKGSFDDLAQFVNSPRPIEYPLHEIDYLIDKLKETMCLLPTYILDTLKSQMSFDNNIFVNATSAGNDTAFLKEIADHRRQIHSNWNQLWSSLSSDKAPWDSSKGRKGHFMKRDNINCYANCPFRMRINNSYTDHAAEAFENHVGPEKPKPAYIHRRRSSSHVNALAANESYDSILILEQDQTPPPPVEAALTNHNAMLQLECIIVKPSKQKDATLKLYHDCIEIAYVDNDRIKIPFDEIRHIYRRTRCHKYTAVEIFTFSSAPIFVDFVDPPNKLLTKLEGMIPTHVHFLTFKQQFAQSSYTREWANGNISNFAYLMHLNSISGRTFNDLAQYPIFPWVVFDMTSKSLNFKSPEIYRDFSKPIGAMNPAVVEKLRSIMDERRTMSNEKPYLYSSGPVSRLIICSYLIRMEPFATLHIELQSGHFDVADRLFSSIPESLSIVRTLANDNRELIPEFFFQPEMFTNDNNFNLGKRFDKDISNVILPPWASNPMEFVYLHRKALESNYVSEHINEWIDLIWGYKQRGKEADNANNLYDSKLYEDCWKTQTNGAEYGLEDFLLMIGQIPPQLLDEPHKKRVIKKSRRLDKQTVLMLSNASSIVFATFDIETGTLITIEENGDVCTYKLERDTGLIWVFQTRKVGVVSNYLKSFEGRPLFASNGRSTVYVGNESTNTVAEIHRDVREIQIRATNPIRLAASGYWLVTNGNDSTTTFVRHNSQRSFQNFRDVSTCCAVSDMFRVCVTGTFDGSLIISNLGNGVTVKAVDLWNIPGCTNKFTPVNVIITPSWGFIVTEVVEEFTLKHAIAVFNINGLFIKMEKLEGPIDRWCTWVSPRGFDYLGMVSQNKVRTCEAFELEMDALYTLDESIGKIVGFRMSSAAGALIVIGEHGRTEFVPYTEGEDW